MPAAGNILCFTAAMVPPLPGPYWLFTALQWLTLTLHLAAMNILFGGLLVFLLSDTSPLRRLLFETGIKSLPTLMAATITLGVAPLLFVQVIYGRFFYAASIISAWSWFLLIPLVIVTYYLLYIVSFGKQLSVGIKTILLWLAAIGLIYISYTLTMISDLAEKPALWESLYRQSASGTRLNPAIWETFFRWAHSISGAITVAGVAVMLAAAFLRQVRGNTDLLRFGRRVFLIGALHASVLAIIYLLVIDRVVLKGFLASPGLHAVETAIILNIIAILLLYRATRTAYPRRPVVYGSICVFAGIFLMVVTRHYLRLVYLQKEFSPGVLPTAPQWTPFIMFVVTLIIGLITLVWMVRRYFAARELP